MMYYLCQRLAHRPMFRFFFIDYLVKKPRRSKSEVFYFNKYYLKPFAKTIV